MDFVDSIANASAGGPRRAVQRDDYTRRHRDAGETSLEFEFHNVGQRNEIPLGEGRSFDIGERRIAVFNDGGNFFAIDDTCPHMGASLSEGHLDHHVVSCPLHAWRFDIRDGTWCDNRRVHIDSFPVRIEGEKILVGVPADSQPT
jgi:nitrite reductase (NADH) small subunit/3-phenylpropionate/trans-cinnamate dioxygenase ferredoxin subunit